MERYPADEVCERICIETTPFNTIPKNIKLQENENIKCQHGTKGIFADFGDPGNAHPCLPHCGNFNNTLDVIG